MAEFDLEVRCPACGARFKVPRIRRGARQECPVCGHAMRIGGADAYDEDLAEAGRFPEGAPAPPPRPPGFASPGKSWDRPAATPSGRCVICAVEEKHPNPKTVASVVCELTDILPLEARVQVAEGMGVLAEDIDARVAEDIVARLGREGVEAFALDHALIPEVKDVSFVRVSDLTDEGLHLQVDVHGNVQIISWDRIMGGFCTKRRISPGPPRRKAGGGIRSPIHMPGYGTFRTMTRVRTRSHQPSAREQEARCALLARAGGGGLGAVTFSESQVSYAYLKERLKPRGPSKFQLLISDILRHTPGAFYPPSTWDVAVGQLMRIAWMKEDDDYPAYRRWMVCKIAYHWRRASE